MIMRRDDERVFFGVGSHNKYMRKDDKESELQMPPIYLQACDMKHVTSKCTYSFK